MFTASDINKVMEATGFDDDEIILMEKIDSIVDQASNTGVILESIAFWLVDEGDEIGGLLTYEVADGLRLASAYIDKKRLVSTAVGRGGVLHVLTVVAEEIDKIKSLFREIVEVDPA